MSPLSGSKGEVELDIFVQTNDNSCWDANKIAPRPTKLIPGVLNIIATFSGGERISSC